jgi:hypothetical protein
MKGMVYRRIQLHAPRILNATGQSETLGHHCTERAYGDDPKVLARLPKRKS